MNEGALSTFNKTKNYIVGLVIASFNESLSHFSDLEKNFVGQRVVPSPAKNKIDPAPRDRTPSGSVKYPHIKEGYAKSEKDERAAEAFDNLDIVIKSSFASDTKETFEVMGLKIETKQLVWILINEDSDKELAGVIAAISQSLEQTKNAIRLSAVARSKIEERL